MINKLYLLLCLLLTVGITQAQDQRIAETDLPLAEVEQMLLPTLDNKQLLLAEEAARVPGRAPRYAENVEVFVTPETHGNWETLDNGDLLWRLRVRSAAARSLNFGFTKYFMPAGGTLILYSYDKSNVMGPFSPADNEEHEQLWTPIVRGDETVIEVRLPAAERANLELELKYVNHDFVGFGEPSALLSGSCNLDVICNEEDGWEIVNGYRDIIQSVAVIGINGSTFCTGFLVNSVREDCAPLFMTANHCGIGPGNAPSLVTYWNFINSTCRQPGSPESGAAGDGMLNDFNTGATHLASYAPSDMTIVMMDDPISETADAFFAGWDATETIPESCIGVHHPSTDEKRISFENDPLIEGIGLANQPSDNGDHLIVPDWDIGTTEPGSSGSPIFNAEKRVVGQLHGGGAACGNDLYDTYGWMFTSWEGGGTPSTRLKDWLDPDDTGITVIDGRGQMQCNFFVDADPAVQNLCAPTELVYNIEVSATFETDVTLDVTNLPAGATATFSETVVAPGGTATLTVSGLAGIAEGTYTFVLTGTDGTEMTESDLVINVVNDAPAQAVLEFPMNAAEDVSPAPSFIWIAAEGIMHEFQLATDVDFMNITDEATSLNTTGYNASGLDTETVFYWRVRSTNTCGSGEWSETFSFTTGNCSINASADIPVTIDAGPPNTIESVLNVPFSGTITDLDVVGLSGIHTFLGDLTFTLTSPEGTAVVLISDACGGDENFNVSFDDSADGTPPCPYNDGGTYQPVGSLADFVGENAQGDWTLTVADNAGFDGGTLQNWSLQICAADVVNVSASVSPSSLTLCNSDNGSFEVAVNGDFTGNVNVTATSSPAGLPVTIADPTTTSGGTVTATLDNLTAVSPGVYTITFVAADGEVTATTGATVIVETVPALPALSAPAAGATGVSETPTFTWSVIANATTYQIEIATDENFDNIVDTGNPNNASYVLPAGILQDDAVYYWRVTASNDCGGSLSASRTFTADFISGINDLDGNSVEVFPNPTAGTVQVRFGAAVTETVRAEVYGLNGQLLQDQTVIAGAMNISVDLREYPEGIYLLKLKTAGDVLVRRIALQR